MSPSESDDLDQITDRLKTSQRIVTSDTEDVSTDPTADQFTTYVPDPLVGKKLDGGRYHILSVLGRGGMSVVYKARQELVDRPVAIKTLTCQLLGDPVVLKRFQREIRALSKLSHPNIVSAFDCVVDSSGQPYFIMDYLDGESLAEVIYDQGALAPNRVRRMFLQVCHAVSHAHNLQVLHRDLKPANIMIVNVGTQDELVKVVDFGLAKLSEDAQKLTVTGEVWGSPSYMSPEQVYGKSHDARSDIYSVGCVMFEALTGRPPFQGATPIDTVMMQVNAKPPTFAEAAPELDIHPSLEAIVMSCLQKNPDERFQSMAEMATALQEVDLDSPPPIKAPRPKPADPAAPSVQLPTEKRLPETCEFEPTRKADVEPRSIIGRPVPSAGSAQPRNTSPGNVDGGSVGGSTSRTVSGASSPSDMRAPQVVRASSAMRSGTSQNNQRVMITAIVAMVAVFALTGLAATFYFLGRGGGPATPTTNPAQPPPSSTTTPTTGTPSTTPIQTTPTTHTPPSTTTTTSSTATPPSTPTTPPTAATPPSTPTTPTTTATPPSTPTTPTTTATPPSTPTSPPTTATPPATPTTTTSSTTKSTTANGTKGGATPHHPSTKSVIAKTAQTHKPTKHHQHGSGDEGGSTYVPPPVDDAQRWYDIQKSWSH